MRCAVPALQPTPLPTVSIHPCVSSLPPLHAPFTPSFPSSLPNQSKNCIDEDLPLSSKAQLSIVKRKQGSNAQPPFGPPPNPFSHLPSNFKTPLLLAFSWKKKEASKEQYKMDFLSLLAAIPRQFPHSLQLQMKIGRRPQINDPS